MQKGEVVTWIEDRFTMWCFTEDLHIEADGSAYSEREIFCEEGDYIRTRTYVVTSYEDLGEALLAELEVPNAK
jgi:hypothetical protein